MGLHSNQNDKTSMIGVTPILFYYIFLVGLFIIGLYFLYEAIQTYNAGNVEDTAFSAILGIMGVGMSIYMATILRRRVSSRQAPQKVLTTIECKKCGFKKLRRFVKGDYVLMDVENCMKCDIPMTINAIYAEKVEK